MTRPSYGFVLFSWDFFSPLLPTLVQLTSTLFSDTPIKQQNSDAIATTHNSDLRALLGVVSNDEGGFGPGGEKKKSSKGGSSSASRRSHMQTFTMQSHKRLLNHASVIHGACTQSVYEMYIIFIFSQQSLHLCLHFAKSARIICSS